MFDRLKRFLGITVKPLPIPVTVDLGHGTKGATINEYQVELPDDIKQRLIKMVSALNENNKDGEIEFSQVKITVKAKQ